MRIGIIKLGADGDVIRTLPIAKVLKKQYPDSELTWITHGDVAELLEGNPYITNVVKTPFKDNLEFDILYNFDIEKEATTLAGNINAQKKQGFFSDGENMQGTTLGAEYYLNSVFDDETKIKNKRTYQEMMFEAGDIPYNKEHCPIFLSENDRYYAKEYMLKNKITHDKKIIGIHMGASSRWPSKVWAESKLKEFITQMIKNGHNIILFGGPNEAEEHEILIKKINYSEVKVFRNNPYNTKREFAALVDICSLMVCGDSFALHVALALGKKTVGLFFCTPPYEIEGYNILKKITSPLLYNIFPHRMDQYDLAVANSISAEEVCQAVEEMIN